MLEFLINAVTIKIMIGMSLFTLLMFRFLNANYRTTKSNLNVDEYHNKYVIAHMAINKELESYNAQLQKLDNPDDIKNFEKQKPIFSTDLYKHLTKDI